MQGPGDKDILATLRILRAYHVLTRLDVPWRIEIAYRCTCVGFFKSRACENAIVATMMLDESIEIPTKYCMDRPPAVVFKKTVWGYVEFSENTSEDDCMDQLIQLTQATKKSLDFSCLEDTPSATGADRVKHKMNLM